MKRNDLPFFLLCGILAGKGRKGRLKSYSIACMRRECQTQYRLLMGEAVLSLAFAAASGAVWT